MISDEIGHTVASLTSIRKKLYSFSAVATIVLGCGDGGMVVVSSVNLHRIFTSFSYQLTFHTFSILQLLELCITEQNCHRLIFYLS